MRLIGALLIVLIGAAAIYTTWRRDPRTRKARLSRFQRELFRAIRGYGSNDLSLASLDLPYDSIIDIEMGTISIQYDDKLHTTVMIARCASGHLLRSSEVMRLRWYQTTRAAAPRFVATFRTWIGAPRSRIIRMWPQEDRVSYVLPRPGRAS